MQLSANVLFQVALKHSYFKDGLLKGLTCLPTDSGKLQLENIQGVCHSYHGGIAAVSPQAKGNTTVSPRIKDTNIAFALKLTNPDFINFTTLQDLPPGMVLYGNNLGSANRPVKMSSIRVRPPQWEIDLAPLLPKTLNAQRHILITRPNGAVVLDQSFVTSPKDTTCRVNLRSDSDGAYTVAYTAGGKTIDQLFFKWDAGVKQNVLGFFEWFGHQGGQAQSPTTLGAESTLQFERRKTFWQYYLVLKNKTDFKNPHIAPVTVGTQTVNFVQTNSNVLLPDGKHAVEFTSDQLLPLQESPKMDILLEATGLIKGMQLPYAAPDLLYEASTPTARNSKIYVYF